MADRPLSLQDVQWRDIFMFTRIFRAFRVAIRPSKMLLALTALLLMYGGGRLLDAMWPEEYAQRGQQIRESVVTYGSSQGIFESFLHRQVLNFSRITANTLDWSWGYPSGVPGDLANFVIFTPVSYWRANSVFFTILFAWFLLVWALFGGAICRIAAIHVARDEVISPLRAMRFALRAFPSFVAAPLIPLIIVMLLGGVMALLGLLLYVPAVGPILTGVLLVLAILIGLVMTVLTVGAVTGSGLMYPAIAVEGADAFDTVSRALSHVYAAPWRLLFYTAVAIVYGAVTYFFVRVCAYVLLALVHFFTAWFVFGDAQATWKQIWPGPTDITQLAYRPDWATLSVAGDVAAGIVAVWVYLVIALVAAYVVSFYFSASTIIYLLMRRKVDATEMDAVYLEAADEQIPEIPTIKAEPPEPFHTPQPPEQPPTGEGPAPAVQ